MATGGDASDTDFSSSDGDSEPVCPRCRDKTSDCPECRDYLKMKRARQSVEKKTEESKSVSIDSTSARKEANATDLSFGRRGTEMVTSSVPRVSRLPTTNHTDRWYPATFVDRENAAQLTQGRLYRGRNRSTRGIQYLIVTFEPSSATDQGDGQLESFQLDETMTDVIKTLFRINNFHFCKKNGNKFFFTVGDRNACQVVCSIDQMKKHLKHILFSRFCTEIINGKEIASEHDIICRYELCAQNITAQQIHCRTGEKLYQESWGPITGTTRNPVSTGDIMIQCLDPPEMEALLEIDGIHHKAGDLLLTDNKDHSNIYFCWFFNQLL